ncbi:MAG: hypothetical protein GKR96_12375 [Gammaproteobacteria bacterium]|nr:hypothetical protein [Gammaproteobacteria bacterium]
MHDSQSNLQSAIAMLNQKRYAEAEHQAMKVKAGDALFSRALEVAAVSIERLDRCAEALILLEYAFFIEPTNANIQYNLGVFYAKVGDENASMMAYQTCLRIKPDHVDALWNYTEQLRIKEHFDAALLLLERLESILPKHRLGDFHHRFGVTLFYLGHMDKARRAFGRSLAVGGSEPAVTQWEYSHLLLALGDWQKGWLAYDYRFAAGHRTNVVCHHYPYPLWQGENLEGKTLLVHGEQGLGDEIMFGQILFDIEKEAGQIVWGCRPSLVRLFANSHQAIDVVPHRVIVAPADVSGKEIHYHVPICSLGRWRRTESADFEVSRGLLRADSEQVVEFDRALVTSMNGVKKYRVGIMWGANPALGVRSARQRSVQKSIPIDYLRPLVQYCDQIQFVSLQNKEAAMEAASLPQLDMIDFADTAALVENMDLIISVDTSVAHLAGAMGKPVWVLLMHQADWRWMREGEKSVWYKSAKLLRQPRQGDWGSVISDLCSALDEWLRILE